MVIGTVAYFAGKARWRDYFRRRDIAGSQSNNSLIVTKPWGKKMTALKLLLFTCVLFSASLAKADTVFDQLASQFEKASVPVQKDIAGYWAGRCVEGTHRDTLLPAVLVEKVINDPASFPPKRRSFSYYRSEFLAPAAYDRMTPTQVERDADIRRWFEQEQWQAATTVDGSVVTNYDMEGGIKIERALRLYQDEFTQMILLRVTRTGELSKAISRYCYFDKKLGTDAVVPPPPVSHYSFGNTGFIRNQWVRFMNPSYGVDLVQIQLRNGDGRVRIRDARIILGPQQPTGTAATFVMAPYSAGVIALQGMPSFKATAFEFYVWGATSNIEVTGLTSRGEIWRGNLSQITEVR